MRVHEVLGDFCLSINGHCFSSVACLETNPVVDAVELDTDTIVDESFAVQAFSNAGIFEHVDCSLFQNPSTNPAFHMDATVLLQNDGLYSLFM